MPKYILRLSTDEFNLKRLNKEIFPSDDCDLTPNTKFWLLYKERNAIGFCSVRPISRSILFLSRAGLQWDHRGHGLHRRMIKARIKYARQNNYKCIITYTIYSNTRSARNLIKEGFELYDPEWEYAGKHCLYFKKEL